MRNFLLTVICVIISGGLYAQSSGYLYIESDPPRDFYLRTRDSLFTSSPGGYLILAPLGAVTGDIIVGFPGRQQAAFVFTVKDTTVEKGLLLKDMQAEGWRLIDWQKNEPMNVRRLGRQENEQSTMIRRSDPFALRLSQVVNDTAILYYSAVEKQAVTATRKGTDNDQAMSEIKKSPVTTGKEPKIPDTLSTPAEKSRENQVDSTVLVKPGATKKKGTVVTPAAAGLKGNVRTLGKKDMGKSWKLIFEVTEGTIKDTILVEIDKKAIPAPQKGKPATPKAKPVPKKTK
jgi:hypothetical protein